MSYPHELLSVACGRGNVTDTCCLVSVSDCSFAWLQRCCDYSFALLPRMPLCRLQWRAARPRGKESGRYSAESANRCLQFVFSLTRNHSVTGTSSVHLPLCLATHPLIRHPPVRVSVYVFLCPPTHPSVCLSIHPSIRVSVFRFCYRYVCMYVRVCVCMCVCVHSEEFYVRV
jgi:hypothetical protein